MDRSILDWLKNHVGQTFRSPREIGFGEETRRFRIIEIDEELEKVEITFIDGSLGLPLFFWMFDRAFAFIQANRDRAVRVGARVQRPYDPDTVEGKIWENPLLYPASYKASPHVCDLLVLAGLATYQETENPETHRIVQGIKYASMAPQNKPEGGSLPETTDKREKFIRKYKQAIIEWTGKNEDKIVSGRLGYSWRNKSTSDCVRERNEVSRAIIMSRIMNGGAIDLDTLDKVIMWGFSQKYPKRDSKEALEVTKKAFGYLDGGKLKDAMITLLNVPGVGISRASKILALFDQENLCIYDSRVGKALEDLKHGDEKIILCPPGRTYPGDQGVMDEEWAANYQRLIWTLEIVRDCLNERGQTYRLADVEMALFMIGKTDRFL